MPPLPLTPVPVSIVVCGRHSEGYVPLMEALPHIETVVLDETPCHEHGLECQLAQAHAFARPAAWVGDEGNGFALHLQDVAVDLVEGGMLDVVTMGGGGLPMSTVEKLLPVLKTLDERADGNGSPGKAAPKDYQKGDPIDF